MAITFDQQLMVGLSLAVELWTRTDNDHTQYMFTNESKSQKVYDELSIYSCLRLGLEPELSLQMALF